jgi:hypothetical protein
VGSPGTSPESKQLTPRQQHVQLWAESGAAIAKLWQDPALRVVTSLDTATVDDIRSIDFSAIAKAFETHVPWAYPRQFVIGPRNSRNTRRDDTYKAVALLFSAATQLKIRDKNNNSLPLFLGTVLYALGVRRTAMQPLTSLCSIASYTAIKENMVRRAAAHERYVRHSVGAGYWMLVFDNIDKVSSTLKTQSCFRI